jgi:hypothetical protein
MASDVGVRPLVAVLTRARAQPTPTAITGPQELRPIVGKCHYFLATDGSQKFEFCAFRSVRQILMLADANGDGKIEYAEFAPLGADIIQTMRLRQLNAAEEAVRNEEAEIMAREVIHGLGEEEIVEMGDGFGADEMCEGGEIGVVGLGFAAADGRIACGGAAGAAEVGEDFVGDLLGEGAEGRPLAADE